MEKEIIKFGILAILLQNWYLHETDPNWASIFIILYLISFALFIIN